MKTKSIFLKQIVACILFCLPLLVVAQKNNNNNNNPSKTALNNNNNNNNNNNKVNAPFDVGIGALILTGIAYGVKKAYSKRKKNTSDIGMK